MSCPQPVPESLGWHLQRSEGHGAAPGPLLIPPLAGQSPSGDSSLYFINSQTLLWECWNAGSSWKEAITRTDRELIPESPGEPAPLSGLCYHGSRGTCSPWLHPEREKAQMERKRNWNPIRRSACPPCCRRAGPGTGGADSS